VAVANGEAAEAEQRVTAEEDNDDKRFAGVSEESDS